MVLRCARYLQQINPIPGPTEPNRYYSLTGTSYGKAFNDVDQTILGYPMKSIFDQLNEAGKTSKIYFHDVSQAMGLKRMRTLQNIKKFRPFADFYADLKNGNLADFTFIEPLFNPGVRPATDQHPDHSVIEGEAYMKELYEHIRASKTWNETLFIITYDEHGGFFDHFPPP